MNSKRILSLLLVGAMGMALSGCQSDNSASSSQEVSTPAGVAVQVEEIVLQSVATENKVSGKVVAESATSIMVGSSAKCTAVYVEAGDLAESDCEPYRRCRPEAVVNSASFVSPAISSATARAIAASSESARVRSRSMVSENP